MEKVSFGELGLALLVHELVLDWLRIISLVGVALRFDLSR
jgi:hypothetical protein